MSEELTREQIKGKRLHEWSASDVNILCDMALALLDSREGKVDAPVDGNGLKACPFCGGTDLNYDEPEHIGNRVSCFTCGASGGKGSDSDTHGAKNAWNTRAATPEPKAMRSAVLPNEELNDWADKIVDVALQCRIDGKAVQLTKEDVFINAKNALLQVADKARREALQEAVKKLKAEEERFNKIAKDIPNTYAQGCADGCHWQTEAVRPLIDGKTVKS